MGSRSVAVILGEGKDEVRVTADHATEAAMDIGATARKEATEAAISGGEMSERGISMPDSVTEIQVGAKDEVGTAPGTALGVPVTLREEAAEAEEGCSMPAICGL
jgi:hypothetical protein